MSTIIVTQPRPTILRSGSIVRQSGVLTVSDVLMLSADAIIPVTHHVMQVSGDGGPVTLSSLPTVQTSGIVQGQRVFLLGASDQNLVTVQDGRSVAGSALRLQYGRNFTLGLYDVLELVYIGAWWLEWRRVDNS